MKKQLLFSFIFLFSGLQIVHANKVSLLSKTNYPSNLTFACSAPFDLSVSQITTSSAKLMWFAPPQTTNSWEILMIPTLSPNIPDTPPTANPILDNGAVLFSVTGNNPFTTANDLQASTYYIWYVRTVCTSSQKSSWSQAKLFNTLLCSNSESCTYTFYQIENSASTIWNGGEVEVRQNGIVLTTLGIDGYIPSEGVDVLICNDEAFDLYWSNAGNMPQTVSFMVVDPNNDIVFSKMPGEGSPLTVLYSSINNCSTPTCPKPIDLLATDLTQTTATLSWTETGDATQWEVYVAIDGAPKPINGTPLNENVASYYTTNSNTNFLVSNLNLLTKYTFYVRSICNSSTIGNWTILNAATFKTTPVNTNCSAAISVPVNPGSDCLQWVVGSTYGATPSANNTCSGAQSGDVWYSFVATNTIHAVSLSTDLISWFDYFQFTAYSGADCGNLTQLICSNDGTVMSNLVVGATYKIAVSLKNANWNNPNGNFEVCITTLPQPFVANDDCQNAIVIPVSNLDVETAYISGTTTGATFSPQINTCDGVADDDIWYKFTATSSKHFINLKEEYTDLMHAVYESGDCENIALKYCSDENFSTAENLTIGQEYKIRVWSKTANYTLNELQITVLAAFTPLQANSTQFSTAELVNNVLVNNPCMNISNITSSTGSTSQTNGIGYFTNTNPLFPLHSGIVLSTGKAADVGGPNLTILNAGGAGGDAELETVIGAATGQSMSSTNATKVEFDFTSQNEFMSFNFLFASEEYGVYQCAYADAFAFLLTDLTTGQTKNLAVVPGTNLPVSVVTIRNNENNSSCASSNSNLFDYFYDGLNRQVAPINFNGQTKLMSASSVIIPNNPYHIKLVIADRQDSGFDSAVFLQAGSFSSGPPQCSDKIELISFIDSNNNGIRETSEPSFTNGSFVYQLNDAGENIISSSSTGTHTIYDENPLNSYDISYSIEPEFASYYSGATSFENISIPAGSGTETLYFPITEIQGFTDLSVTIIPIAQPVAGSSYANKVVYQNVGTIAAAGVINYTKAASVTISTTESGVVVTPTGFTYNFSNLAPFETRSFIIQMNVPAAKQTNESTTLSSNISITSATGDTNSSNNSFQISQAVVSEANFIHKTEAHGTKLNSNTFTQDEFLFYTIYFENKATVNVNNIRVQDVLDAQLDEESVRMVSASHNYTMERVGNQLNWNFDFIYLPSNLESADLSKGYLTFKVKVKPGFQAGDVIPNFAEIYFDLNPMVATNIFLSEFEIDLGTKVFSTHNILLYPNPTNALIHVNLQDTNESLKNIVVYDMIGKTIKTISGNRTQQARINVGNLAKGIYLLEITTDSNLKQVRKFIVN